ncbi:hypothetical protein [Liquorilactobacillus nagelii]|uniref:hypothetical protein n=1 Tax=Liquorilactobacillus nagelii TaxID=82688 RepID=UPI0039ED6C99
MNWDNVFMDIKKWMQASNQIMQRYPITSNEYWHWLVGSLGHLEQKYNSHPVVVGFCVSLMNYEELNWKKQK